MRCTMDEVVRTTGTPSCQSCLYKEQYPTIRKLLDFFFFFEGGFVNRLAQGGRGHISLSKSLKVSDIWFIWLEHIVGGSPKPLATGHKKQDIKYFTWWWNSVFFPSSMLMNEWSFLSANCSSGIPPKCTKCSTGRSRKWNNVKHLPRKALKKKIQQPLWHEEIEQKTNSAKITNSSLLNIYPRRLHTWA